MSEPAEKGNQGIVISGGTFNAGDVVVGKNATINKVSNAGSEADSSIEQLKEELARLIDTMEQHKVDPAQTDVAKAAKDQLESDSPNMHIVKSLLETAVESVKTMGGISKSAMAVKSILDSLL